jgi:hypothetical protein
MHAGTTDAPPRRPSALRLMLVFCVFVGVAGGVMALLGLRPLWPVFSAVGAVLVLAAIRRSR